MEDEIYDLVIIGSGPAGISAALYTIRANLDTVVFDTGESSLNKAGLIENYYGFEEPVKGSALLESGKNQVKKLGAEIKAEEVTSVEMCENSRFLIRTSVAKYKTKAVLIATGKLPNRPKLPGISDFEGKGVSYCTTCDGFFYRGKAVGILGSGNYAVQEAMELKAFTNDITIFTDGHNTSYTGIYQQQAEDFKTNNESVKGVTGNKKVESIQLESGPQSIDGLFIALGTASSADFAVKLGVAVNNGEIIADTLQRTNLEGVFAAGDCTGGFRQISTAVGQGAIAGKSIIEYVRRK